MALKCWSSKSSSTCSGKGPAANCCYGAGMSRATITLMTVSLLAAACGDADQSQAPSPELEDIGTQDSADTAEGVSDIGTDDTSGGEDSGSHEDAALGPPKDIEGAQDTAADSAKTDTPEGVDAESDDANASPLEDAGSDAQGGGDQDAQPEPPDATTDAEDAVTAPCPGGCDDGLACNGVETCDEATGTCQPGAPLCDDGDPCTDDVCDEVIGFCDVVPVDCSDGNPCTDDTCDSETGACLHSDTDCGDDDLCTDDWCAPPAGGCFWDAVTCDDGDPCTDDLCDPELGCLTAPITCDDEVTCTIDSCEAGTCVHTPDHTACADNVACTVDSCEAEGCLNTPDAALCSDDNPCTTDTCEFETGCAQLPVICDDALPCTMDGCDEATGLCTHPPIDCSNGDPCDGLETCDPSDGACLAGTPVSCPDDDACDGLESCDPSTGLCVNGPPVDCYPESWDGCDGVKTCHPSGVCETTPLGMVSCPVAPDACDQSGGVDGPVSGKVTTGPGSVFVLKDQMQWNEKAAIADQIAEHWSVQYVTLETIIDTDLNRQGGSISLDGIDCFEGGFWWNDGDNEVDYWWPQGVTSSADAWGPSTPSPGGTVSGKPLLVVSWYHKAEEDSSTSTYKGVRLGIVDLTTYDYRLVLLAEPVCDGTITAEGCQGTPTYAPLSTSSSSLHAGGIVWYQNYLFVADTSHGFRVFDMNRIQRVQTGDSNALGYKASADAYLGYNYRYVIPQTGRYQHCGDSCCARFSWVSLDPTTSPPSLLAGEYVSGETSGRAHRWSLDTSDGRLVTTHGTATSVASYFPAVKNMQGGLSVDGHYFFSSSAPKLSWPPSLGSMHDAALGGNLTTHQYPQLPEDLSYNPYTDAIWSCTEEPATWLGQTRYCFRFDRADLVNGSCD